MRCQGLAPLSPRVGLVLQYLQDRPTNNELMKVFLTVFSSHLYFSCNFKILLFKYSRNRAGRGLIRTDTWIFVVIFLFHIFAFQDWLGRSYNCMFLLILYLFYLQVPDMKVGKIRWTYVLLWFEWKNVKKAILVKIRGNAGIHQPCKRLPQKSSEDEKWPAEQVPILFSVHGKMTVKKPFIL